MNGTDGKGHQGYVSRVIAGAGVGAIVGLFSGVILLAVGANKVAVPTISVVVPGHVFMTTTIIAGIIAGATGATIGTVGRPFRNAVGSALGGAIGGAIGGMIGGTAIGLTPDAWFLEAFSGACAGAGIGFISGSIIAGVGMPLGARTCAFGAAIGGTFGAIAAANFTFGVILL